MSQIWWKCQSLGHGNESTAVLEKYINASFYLPDPSVFNYNAGLLMYISAMDHQLLLVTDLYERDPKDTMQ